MQFGAGFRGKARQKGLEGGDAGHGKLLGARQSKHGGQLPELPLQKVTGVGEAQKSGVAAQLGRSAEDGDGTQLFQDVRIAHDHRFGRGGLIVRLVFPDHGADVIDLAAGEVGGGQNGVRALLGVGDVIPARELIDGRGPVAGKDAEVVEPDGRKDDVVVVRQRLTDAEAQVIEPRLMSELVHGTAFGSEQPLQFGAELRRCAHGGRLARPASWSRECC